MNSIRFCIYHYEKEHLVFISSHNSILRKDIDVVEAKQLSSSLTRSRFGRYNNHDNDLNIPDIIKLLVFLNTKLHIFKDCRFGRFEVKIIK